MEYVSEVVSFIAGGLLGSFLTLQWSKNVTSKGHSTTIEQSNARAGRDISAIVEKTKPNKE